MSQIDITTSAALQGVEGRFRSLSQGDLTLNFAAGINAPVNAVIVGQPKPLKLLGESIFRQVPAAWNFQYRKYFLERFHRKDARREMRAAFGASDFRVDNVTGKLQRYGYASLMDRDELGVAQEVENLFNIPLGVQAKAASLARDVVDLSLEYDRSVVALASASYDGTLDTTLSANSEFNDPTNGDSRTAIRSFAESLCAKNGLINTDAIKVYLTRAAFHAALDDPKFIARRQYAVGPNVATADDLVKYWGVGSVEVGDAFYSSDGTTLTSMYGDVAILAIDSQRIGQDYDTREGVLDSFVRFTWSGAQGAMMPWFEQRSSTWYFPYEWWETQVGAVNPYAQAIIRNCAA